MVGRVLILVWDLDDIIAPYGVHSVVGLGKSEETLFTMLFWWWRVECHTGRKFLCWSFSVPCWSCTHVSLFPVFVDQSMEVGSQCFFFFFRWDFFFRVSARGICLKYHSPHVRSPLHSVVCLCRFSVLMGCCCCCERWWWGFDGNHLPVLLQKQTSTPWCFPRLCSWMPCLRRTLSKSRWVGKTLPIQANRKWPKFIRNATITIITTTTSTTTTKRVKHLNILYFQNELERSASISAAASFLLCHWSSLNFAFVFRRDNCFFFSRFWINCPYFCFRISCPCLPSFDFFFVCMFSCIWDDYISFLESLHFCVE